MRISADASAAHLEITIGLVLQLLTLATTLPMILLGPSEVARVGWVLFGMAELAVTLVLLQAIRRLHGTVVPGPAGQPAQSELQRAMPTEPSAALQASPFSVTEGTTELMNSAEAPISVKPSKSTDSI